jgi:hypothetical protein
MIHESTYIRIPITNEGYFFIDNSADLRANSASLSGGIMTANVVRSGGSPDFLFGRFPD